MLHRKYEMGFYFILYQSTKRVDFCYAGYEIVFYRHGNRVRCEKPKSKFLPEAQIDALEREAFMLMHANALTKEYWKEIRLRQKKQTESLEKITAELIKEAEDNDNKQNNLFPKPNTET